MNFEAAQQDMREGYLSGAPGVIVSGAVWLVAAAVATQASARAAMLTLFFGGMLIFPLGLVLAKMMGGPGRHAPGNPLGGLAGEGTFWMLACIPIAFAAAMTREHWFFPAMLLIIGGRYLTFCTLYGLRAYWVLGVVLVAFAVLLVLLKAPVAFGAFAGAAAELVFGFWLWTAHRRSPAQPS